MAWKLALASLALAVMAAGHANAQDCFPVRVCDPTGCHTECMARSRPERLPPQQLPRRPRPDCIPDPRGGLICRDFR